MFQRHPIQHNVPMLVTAVTLNRRRVFADPAYAREAIETLYRVEQLHPFLLYGFVIMPDHCHFLMEATAPESISKIMNVYKSGLTFNTGLRKIWMPRFHISIAKKPPGALNYIHMNPVRAGLAAEPENYPWSSAAGKWEVSTLAS